MILTFELNLFYFLKMSQLVRYVGQRSFGSKVIIWNHRYAYTHTRPIALPGPLKWSLFRQWHFFQVGER